MRRNTGRYSIYIRPFSYLVDLLIINFLCNYFLDSVNGVYSHFFITVSWLVISFYTGFYKVYRYTKPFEIFEKIIKQYFFFAVVNFAYVGYFSKNISSLENLKFITSVLIATSAVKLFIYYFLKKFRVAFGGNYRNVIVVGNEKNVNELTTFFNEHLDYGYKLKSVFNLNSNRHEESQTIFNFVSKNNIDEIYCAIADLSEEEILDFEDFADANLKTLKFIPDQKEVAIRNSKFEYYGYIPIIALRNIPLDEATNAALKRLFDIVFSLFVILFVLSWLIPIMAILIKLESKGPVFFKQKRNGLNYKEFDCYKFRSMHLNDVADIELVTKTDPRITRTGKFIRSTSIDEMPQFFNVLLGEMSVVGPRPQMLSVNKDYQTRIDKFMVRHFIKPGITGLAQTNGFRGEVEKDEDIENRVKFDIFYIENWTLFLDIKIIFNTIYNALIGDDKAY
jgi:putative colanic acid biosysnthesis UDP-glucose lipid carrier transferase